MKYDDPTQDLHIDLKAGEQLLDGDKAEQLVRFRHGNWDPKTRTYPTYPAEYGDNDLGRMRTQREFIMQVIKQTAKVENIFKIGEILDVAKNNLITNIDFDVAKDYIPYIVEFDTANILTSTLPGTVPDLSQTNNVSIFVYNKKKNESFGSRIILRQGQDRRRLRRRRKLDNKEIRNKNRSFKWERRQRQLR